MKIILLVLICSIAVAVWNREKRLSFRPDGTFSVMQFTDLHYGEGDNLDESTTNLMRKLVQAEDPDFIAFTGDMVSGYSWNKSQGWYEAMWHRWTKVIYETKKPYCYTLGNHDSEADLDRQEILKLDMTNPYSYTQLFPDNMAGASTFVIPVYSSKHPEKVVMNLWFFDSGDYNCLGVNGYGCVEPKMIDWYKRMSRQLEIEQGGKKPAVAFMHIPPVEYLYAYNHYPSVGRKTEACCCSSMNTGIIAAFKERGDVIALFCGHDHSNDYVNDFEGILLGYGRKTGYGCYGPAEGMQRGGRMLKFVEEDFKMSTYVVNEDGTHEIQTEQASESDQVDVCGGSKPPKWIVCLIYDLRVIWYSTQ